MSRPTRFRKMYSFISSKLDYAWNEGKRSLVKQWTHRRFRRVSKQNLLKDNIHDARDECG